MEANVVDSLIVTVICDSMDVVYVIRSKVGCCLITVMRSEGETVAVGKQVLRKNRHHQWRQAEQRTHRSFVIHLSSISIQVSTPHDFQGGHFGSGGRISGQREVRHASGGRHE
jgi:hypothetical protein